MKKILSIISSLFIGVFMFSAVSGALLPGAVLAQTPKDAVCDGLEFTGSDCGPGAEGEVSKTIGTAIDIFSIFVGVAAVIMIIIGGFKYIISSGDSNSVNSAKNTILYAVIGLVIVAMAQIIVRFVIDRVG